MSQEAGAINEKLFLEDSLRFTEATGSETRMQFASQHGNPPAMPARYYLLGHNLGTSTLL